MCGIAGFCGPAKSFGDDRLKVMLRAIEHRGPDDSGTFSTWVPGHSDCRVWMGSRRLAIHDLSPAGHQPMVDSDSGDAIAFNGEIYNFLALRTELEREGYRFQSHCDTEVALQSWRQAGIPAVQRWRGMFAGALWNQRNGDLWLVRDEWGIKPLYYRWDGQSLAFASEVRALLAADLAPAKLEWRGVEDYLTFGAIQDPVTIIEGVYALLPGHALHWSNGTVEIQQFSKAVSNTSDGSLDIEAELREIVRLQLASDVPLVVFLSGGIDSSIISLLARQQAGRGVNTMSLVFNEAKYSEAAYARQVSRHIHTKHHEVLVRAEELREHAIEAISVMDQPTSDGINSYIISGAARRAGFTVALTGLGGDEFFGGYGTFGRTSRLERLLKWCRKAPTSARVVSRLLAPGLARVHGAPRKFSQYLTHATFHEHALFLQRTLFFPSQIQALSWGRPSAAAEGAAETRYRQLLEAAAPLDALNQVSFLEARTYMANTLLRDSDQMSMAHSIELRVPMVDQLLARHAFTLSGREKGFGREPKRLLRKAFERQLPPEVFQRKKMGFTLPFAVWLKTSLRQEVLGTLGSGELWRPEDAFAVWNQFEQEKLDWTRPWALYVLSRWVAKNVPAAAEQLQMAAASRCAT